MDVSDFVRRLVRRWIAVVAVVVLAVAVAAIGWSRTGQTRQTVAAVVIVPPKFGTDVTGQNPLLNLDNNLAQLATVLAQAMQSSTVADALRRNGASGSFTVSTVTGTNPSFSQLSPQLAFTVSGSTESQTLFAARTIVSQARVQLAALQDRAGVTASARASLVESVTPTSADAVSGGRLRVAGSLALGVLVLGLLAVLVIDNVLVRRRRGSDPVGLLYGDIPRRRAKRADPPAPAADDSLPLVDDAPGERVDETPAQPSSDDAIAAHHDTDGPDSDSDGGVAAVAGRDDAAAASVTRRRAPTKKVPARKTVAKSTARSTPARKAAKQDPAAADEGDTSRPLRAGR